MTGQDLEKRPLVSSSFDRSWVFSPVAVMGSYSGPENSPASVFSGPESSCHRPCGTLHPRSGRPFPGERWRTGLRRRCTESQPCSRRRRRSRSRCRICSGPWPDRTARLPAIATATRAAAIAITTASSTVSVSAAGTTVTAARSAITATACTAAAIATTSTTAITTRVFRVGRVRGIGRRLHARGAGPAVALRTARVIRVRRRVGHRRLIRFAERRAGAAQVAGVC